jgi:hypothetical protein
MAMATDIDKAEGGEGAHRCNTQQSNRGDSGGWGSHKALAFNLKFKGGRLEYKGESISLDLLFLLSGLANTSRLMDDNQD